MLPALALALLVGMLPAGAIARAKYRHGRAYIFDEITLESFMQSAKSANRFVYFDFVVKNVGLPAWRNLASHSESRPSAL